MDALIKACDDIASVVRNNEKCPLYMSGAMQALHAYIMKNRDKEIYYSEILLRFIKDSIDYYNKLFKGEDLLFYDQVERLDIITSFGVECTHSDEKLVPLNKFDIRVDERKMLPLFDEIKKRIQLLLALSKDYIRCTESFESDLFLAIAPDVDSNTTTLTLAKLISQL